jgi:hypothetical protein
MKRQGLKTPGASFFWPSLFPWIATGMRGLDPDHRLAGPRSSLSRPNDRELCDSRMPADVPGGGTLCGAWCGVQWMPQAATHHSESGRLVAERCQAPARHHTSGADGMRGGLPGSETAEPPRIEKGCDAWRRVAPRGRHAAAYGGVRRRTAAYGGKKAPEPMTHRPDTISGVRARYTAPAPSLVTPCALLA